MTEPLVCAVMITNNRPQLAARAVLGFQQQTYGPKILLVYDTNPATSPLSKEYDLAPPSQTYVDPRVYYFFAMGSSKSIGSLRNAANHLALCVSPDILINWDDDDVSHPTRIASQVRQLQTTLIDSRLSRGGIARAGAVGYQDLLWCDSTKGEAWLYENGSNHYCLGTSLCYWPHFWENNPFPDRNIGEWPQETPGKFGYSSFVDGEPMIIGEWHGKNGANAGSTPSKEPWRIGRDEDGKLKECWKRMPEWDERLRVKMALESAH